MSAGLLSTPTFIAILVIFTLWLSLVTFWLVRSEARFRTLFDGKDKRDLRSVLETLRKDHQTTASEIDELKKAMKELHIRLLPHIQKIGFIRYNPFSDTGGDQSFCLALLDGQDNGVVISSLHSRDQTRIYAKKISRGKSPGYTLSKEERAVITRATG
ncbi:MAG: DUF4446 family protein [Candidatus Chisholmbacteria bacterium]|nr:DUF4446 family protein [Candidatus Chisholmbacteria bacterium]